MIIAQQHQNLINLIVNTQQVIKIEDQRRGNLFEKVIHLKAEKPFQKTITLYFTIKTHRRKESFFPLIDFSRNKVEGIAELNFLSLMIRDSEYKYYENFDNNTNVIHQSPIQLENKFKTTWLELESKIKSHYVL